ncbi:MAG: hypothetical protein IJ780_02705 [Neisseriaceae bacterium]|nr:hypothetical protein [Neisseriaceae bacterium]
MKKLILPLIATAMLCACSHNPPKPSGEEFPLNPIQYYQNSNSKAGE